MWICFPSFSLIILQFQCCAPLDTIPRKVSKSWISKEEETKENIHIEATPSTWPELGSPALSRWAKSGVHFLIPPWISLFSRVCQCWWSPFWDAHRKSATPNAAAPSHWPTARGGAVCRWDVPSWHLEGWAFCSSCQLGIELRIKIYLTLVFFLSYLCCDVSHETIAATNF